MFRNDEEFETNKFKELLYRKQTHKSTASTLSAFIKFIFVLVENTMIVFVP